MLVSLKWLSEYVPLTLPPRELAGGPPPPPAPRRPPPPAPPPGPAQPTVVCGAPNVAVGQKVAFAPAGARIRDGHTGEWTVLKAAQIRGVDSAGMVLSEMGLGLSANHQGILALAGGG